MLRLPPAINARRRRDESATKQEVQCQRHDAGSRSFPSDRCSLDVAAHDGLVVLRGDLPGFSEVRDVIEIARRVPGVRVVHNRLHVGRPGVRDNAYGAFPYGFASEVLPEYVPGLATTERS